MDQDEAAPFENVGTGDAPVERKASGDEQVPFVETLDPQTRTELDEVLERSTMLVRNLMAALYRP